MESIVDLTWASPSAARKIKNWRVAEELETLSDHRYIIIRLLPGGRVANQYKGERQRGRDRGRRQEDPHHPRWAIKKLNTDRLLAAAHAAAWAAPSEETESQDAERQAEWFQTQMARICNTAMPRAKQAGRNATYWWSPELESKRRECVLARRRVQHRKRRRSRNYDEEAQLRLRYRAAVVALQQAIREAKARAWDELLKTIDRDPWGRPYRLVLGKLRPTAPPYPLTESMEPELLEF